MKFDTCTFKMLRKEVLLVFLFILVTTFETSLQDGFNFYKGN